MTLHEPATLATDYLLAALAAWLAWRLRSPTGTMEHFPEKLLPGGRSYEHQSDPLGDRALPSQHCVILNRSAARRWWARALGLTALSAFIGGSYHGFAPNWPALMRPWWILTLLVVCAIGAAMDFARLHEAQPSTASRVWRGIILLKFLGFAIAALAYPKFLVAMIAYGLSLVVWLVSALITHQRWRVPLLSAIGLSIVGGVVQQLRLAPAPWFNHNDLYHVLQALALVGFYQAARVMNASPS